LLMAEGFNKDPFPREDREQIAVALGYVSQVMFLLARYFDIPLPYRIIPFGSRSVVADFSSLPATYYPLYCVDVRTEHFVSALVLLHRNLEQMLVARKLPIKNLGNTLFDLARLLGLPIAQQHWQRWWSNPIAGAFAFVSSQFENKRGAQESSGTCLVVWLRLLVIAPLISFRIYKRQIGASCSSFPVTVDIILLVERTIFICS